MQTKLTRDYKAVAREIRVTLSMRIPETDGSVQSLRAALAKIHGDMTPAEREEVVPYAPPEPEKVKAAAPVGR